jgi:hypothetical protein
MCLILEIQAGSLVDALRCFDIDDSSWLVYRNTEAKHNLHEAWRGVPSELKSFLETIATKFRFGMVAD